MKTLAVSNEIHVYLYKSPGQSHDDCVDQYIGLFLYMYMYMYTKRGQCIGLMIA